MNKGLLRNSLKETEKKIRKKFLSIIMLTILGRIEVKVYGILKFACKVVKHCLKHLKSMRIFLFSLIMETGLLARDWASAKYCTR